jgi:succinoglycan biosynthesis protein ExoM
MTSRVAICICTYERPVELARALAAIERLETPSLPDADISVIIVDNSEGRSAAEPVAAWRGTSRFETAYHHERRKGLSQARNAALDAAIASSVEYLAFIDDDETPDSGWLEGLLAAMRGTDAVAAMGPVYPLFAHRPPGWAATGGFYACGNPAAGEDVREGRTNNVIIRCEALRRSGLRFEAAFDDVGGEDTALFRQLKESGGRLIAAPDAIVHDWLPPGRLKLPWLLRRWFRTGGVEALLLARRRPGIEGTALNLWRGAARIGAGTALVLASTIAGGWREPGRIVARLETVCRGGGMLAGALGWNYQEYAAKPKALFIDDVRETNLRERPAKGAFE